MAGGCKDGYGKFATGGSRAQKHLRAHRFSYETYIGPIPDGLLIMHKCDTPACVNPDHLAVGTTQDNVNDRMAKSRHRVAPVMSKCKYIELADARLRHHVGETPETYDESIARVA